MSGKIAARLDAVVTAAPPHAEARSTFAREMA